LFCDADLLCSLTPNFEPFTCEPQSGKKPEQSDVLVLEEQDIYRISDQSEYLRS
jgi:hypothetical protein